MTSSRPRIGIATDFRPDDKYPVRDKALIDLVYASAVAAAGGLPLLLPPTADMDLLRESLRYVDALVLTGGFADLPPANYNQEPKPYTDTGPDLRANADLAAARFAIDTGKPLLGVCLGHQTVNVALGGDLDQDIVTETGTTVPHRAADFGHDAYHRITMAPTSRVAAIMGTAELETNSAHHQAVHTAGRGLTVVATSPDGIIEATELESHPFCVTVQWHPERIHHRPEQLALFRALIAAVDGGR